MKTPSPHAPLILAIDVGTSSIRALLYDAAGAVVEGANRIEGRVVYEMRLTAEGGVEIDAEELLALVCRAIDELLRQAEELADAIVGVALCTFWHSLVGVGSDGRALTPLYSWNDTRSRDDAQALARQVDAEALHRRTGVVLHSSYQPARLCWLRRAKPHEFAQVAYWMTFGDYLLFAFFGERLLSVSMASGTGMFNPNTCAWDDELLARTGVQERQLSRLAADDESLSGLRHEYAERWRALKGVPWFPAFGDGACNNIGSGCVSAERVALMVGTSGALRVCFPAASVAVPRGLWCYRANRDFFVLGGALSNGGDVYAWSVKTLALDAQHIEAALAQMEPDAHGLTVLPFFSGERSTGWADAARAVIAGMSLRTTPMEMLRALLEAVAYRFAAIYERLREVVPTGNQVVASGKGLLSSPAWTQIMADVLGVPVGASAVAEASSRGAALLVAKALGLRDSLASELSCEKIYLPIAEHQASYERGLARHQQLYERR